MIDFFQPHEFRCRCGRCGKGAGDMSSRTLERLNVARWHAGVPFIINSAIRCRKHNTAVRGLADSAHLSGHAVDIAASDSALRFRVVEGLLRAGFTRLGIYGWGVHADDDPAKLEHRIWTD